MTLLLWFPYVPHSVSVVQLVFSYSVDKRNSSLQNKYLRRLREEMNQQNRCWTKNNVQILKCNTELKHLMNQLLYRKSTFYVQFRFQSILVSIFTYIVVYVRSMFTGFTVIEEHVGDERRECQRQDKAEHRLFLDVKSFGLCHWTTDRAEDWETNFGYWRLGYMLVDGSHFSVSLLLSLFFFSLSMWSTQTTSWSQLMY